MNLIIKGRLWVGLGGVVIQLKLLQAIHVNYFFHLEKGLEIFCLSAEPLPTCVVYAA